jgi:hypothetical protein
MTISDSTVTLAPSSTRTLTVGNYTGSVTWSSGNESVATVNAATGVVTAVSGGQAIITATNDPANDAPNQTATCTVNVPLVTLTPASQTITSASSSTTYTLTVQYGGTLIPAGSAVAWSSSNSAIGSLTSYTTTLATSGADTLTSTATFTSSSAGTAGSSTITAAITGSGYNTSKTATVTVQTSKYLDIIGPNGLDKTTRTGLYTVYLKNADGSVDTTNSSSTVHWSWSSSYLSITSNDLNDKARTCTAAKRISNSTHDTTRLPPARACTLGLTTGIITGFTTLSRSPD